MLEMQGAPLQKINSSLQFHHIGVAAKNIERELQVYKSLGYECESAYFEDTLQGIRGMFLTAQGAPRLEMQPYIRSVAGERAKVLPRRVLHR